MTIKQALLTASRQIDRRDARVLLGHVLRRDHAWLLAHGDEDLPNDPLEQFLSAAGSRAAGRPLQHILGQQEFYGLPMQVSPDTLIPRPETEILVGAVLAWVSGLEPPCPAERPLRIVDVGTGTGAIAVALAMHLPQAKITALDVSPAVQPVVEANVARFHLGNRVNFLLSDLLGALPESGSWDAVVSNPPYIPEGDGPTLQSEVRDWEPSLALFGGPDGMDVYRRLVPQALAALRPGGLLALEFGFGQRAAMLALLDPWHQPRILEDLAGISRVALAHKPCPQL